MTLNLLLMPSTAALIGGFMIPFLVAIPQRAIQAMEPMEIPMEFYIHTHA
jgi:hypothetical protein